MLGVALLLLITVALVSITGFVLTSGHATSDLHEPTPKVATEFTFKQEGKNIVGRHVGGASIQTDRLTVRGPGEVYFGGDERLESGDTFEIITNNPSAQFSLVYTRPEKSNAVLATAKNPLVADIGGVPPQITTSYEDLKVGTSDYDYNDWAYDMKTNITGFFENDTRHAVEMKMEFRPLARGAGYHHDQYIVPEELGTGTYNLTVYDGNDNVVREESAEFTSDTRIFLMDSKNALDSMDNANNGDTCTEPDRWVKLELDLDNPAVIPDNPINADRQHGAGLPFNPVMEPSGNNEKIGIGDPRMVTVPTDWKWPDERTHIAQAYENVGPEDAGDGDPPEFKINEWFEDTTSADRVVGACR